MPGGVANSPGKGFAWRRRSISSAVQRPGKVPTSWKIGEADDADVARIAVPLPRVRAPHRPEAEGRDLVEVLPEAVDLELGARVEDVAALGEGGALAVAHVEPVHREDDLEPQVGAVLDDDGVAMAGLAHDGVPDPPATKPRQELPALVAQAHGDEPAARVEGARSGCAGPRRGHGARALIVVVEEARRREGRRRIRAVEVDERHARVPGLAPLRAEAGPVLGRAHVLLLRRGLRRDAGSAPRRVRRHGGRRRRGGAGGGTVDSTYS